MNSNLGKQKFFVIYQITNLIDNRIYVGAHCTYDVKDKYMGSSKYLKKDMKELGRHNFKKEILHVLENKEDMMKKEAEIVDREFCHRIDTYNRMEGGLDSFYNIGMLAVKDENGNNMLVYRDDPRYLSGELKSVTKGTISVKDDSGNSIRVKIDDPRYLSGELISTSLGKKVSDDTKRKLSESRIGKYCGENNNFYNKIHSEEVKNIIRESRKRFFKNKKITGEKIKGHPITQDIRDKISSSLKNVVRIKSICPYCNKEGDSRNMKRYHFDNCKNFKNIDLILL